MDMFLVFCFVVFCSALVTSKTLSVSNLESDHDVAFWRNEVQLVHKFWLHC